MEKKFSVIVPVYNSQEYLGDCIESILNQTFTDFELILVNDGSKDDSLKICREYANKDSRIKVLDIENKGVTNARKVGAINSDGEYIVCVDADDFLLDTYLEKMNECSANGKVDVVCCGKKVICGDKKTEEPIEIGEGVYEKADIEKHIYPILFENTFGVYLLPAIWAKAFKREVFIENINKLNGDIKVGEDYAFTKTVIANADTVAVIGECLYCYRVNDKSVTKSHRAFDWKGPELIGKHFEANIDLDKFDFREQVYRCVSHLLFNVCVSQFNRNEKYKVISKDIKTHLRSPYYNMAIKNCKYKNFARKIAIFALKKRLVFLLKIYNRFSK